MVNPKSEKYKGWTIKFTKIRSNLFAEIKKGQKRFDVSPVGSTKQEMLKRAKRDINTAIKKGF